MDVQSFVVPFASAVLGGVVSFIGAHIAMRVELAVLQTEVKALRDSLAGMKENIDEAHRRVDSWYQARRVGDGPKRVRA